MRASSLLKIMLLITGAAVFQPAIATIKEMPVPTVSENANIAHPFLLAYNDSIDKVNTMLTYVNLAYIAIDMDRYGRAESDVRQAQAFASELAIDSPAFVNESRLKYGKLTYDIKGQQVNYYIPDPGKAFIVQDYDGFLTGKNPDEIVVRDARMVTAGLYVDLRKTRNTLDFAISDLQNQRYNSARVELAELHQGALVGETDVENPVWSIHDNLRLTQALIDANQYASAHDSLEHAREQLDGLKHFADTKDSMAIIQKLSNAIIAMEARLQHRNPEPLQKAQRQINQWIHTVDGWMNTSDRRMG